MDFRNYPQGKELQYLCGTDHPASNNDLLTPTRLLPSSDDSNDNFAGTP
jgi:hypothetical protein